MTASQGGSGLSDICCSMSAFTHGGQRSVNFACCKPVIARAQ
jgi:hypothetical protein